MSRSFHITRKDFRHCSKKELDEMMEDDFSEFTEWAKKSHVKDKKIEKRTFAKIYSQMASDATFSDDQIRAMDDREIRFMTLHTRYFKDSKNED